MAEYDFKAFEKRWQAENGPPQPLHEATEEFSL